MRLGVVCLLAACGGGGGNPGGSADGSATADAPVIPTPAVCDVPPEGMLVDVSASTNVVGDGSAASCTEQTLRDRGRDGRAGAVRRAAPIR